MPQFNYRIGNIEARTTQIGFHKGNTIEIVQWSEGSCLVIVYFRQAGDPLQWEAAFVGARPLDDLVSWPHLRHLIQAGYAFLHEQEMGDA